MMSKLEETNAMINAFNSVLSNISNDTNAKQVNKAIFITATCDIAKSLAIIADSVSEEFEEE